MGAAAVLVLACACAWASGSEVLMDFGPGFDLNGVAEQNVRATLAEDGLRIEFQPGARWPGVRLLPPAGRWDLRAFNRVEAYVRNVGTASVRVMVRVDNPGADGRNHCNTDGATLQPGMSRVIPVLFGRSWGGPGFPIDPSNVVGALIFADGPPEGTAVVVERVEAAGRKAPLPDWVGKRPPVPGNWVMTLNEEFEADRLNEDLWTPRFIWSGLFSGHLEAYSPRNVSVKDGMLWIKVEKRTLHANEEPDQPTRDYASGVVTSFDKFAQKYGYFEARIKLPTFRGGWPAFWMMPDRGRGNGNVWQRRSTHDGGMEIDIMEHLCEWGPTIYHGAVHWDGYGKEHKSVGFPNLTCSDTPDGFHVFGLLWEPGRLVWYCDGQKKAEWRNPRVASVPAYLKLNVQVGSWATNDVDDSALPDYMLVDYVRVWQLAERLDRP